MKSRFFSLFALALCFLFHSVAFAMEYENDTDTRVRVSFLGNTKHAILEDLVDYLDPDEKLALEFVEYLDKAGLSAESLKALFPLGTCYGSGKPIMHFFDDQLNKLCTDTKSTVLMIVAHTTTTDLKILTHNRNPSRKLIDEVSGFKKYPSEDFKNYFNALPDAT